MAKRVTAVNSIKVTDVGFSSVFEIGDSKRINAFSKAIAVQREAEMFFGNEGNFQAFPIFTMPLPRPIIDEPITITRYNESPFINVNHANIISLAASGVLHIGSTKTIDAESRVKHIRQLLGNQKRQL